jgi:hypothetical protein
MRGFGKSDSGQFAHKPPIGSAAAEENAASGPPGLVEINDSVVIEMRDQLLDTKSKRPLFAFPIPATSPFVQQLQTEKRVAFPSQRFSPSKK